MRSLSSIITLLLFLYSTLSLCAQSGEFRSENFMSEGSAVICGLGQDSRGIMWLGTDKGLCCYDGYRLFERYKPESKENTRINTLLIINDIILLGTDKGLLVYDIRAGSYVDTPTSYNINGIRSMTAIGENSVAIGGTDGLYVYNVSSNVAKHLATPIRNVYSLCGQSMESLLVGTLHGLFRLEKGRATAIKIGKGQQPLVNAITPVNPNRREDSFWIGTEGALYVYAYGKMSSRPWLKGNSVKSLATVGNVLYAGTDNGLYSLTEAGTIRHFAHDSRRETTIPNNIIWTLATDRWKNLWIGTDNGLSLLRQYNPFTYVPICDMTGSGEGNCIHSLLTEPSGTMWIGGTNGLIRCSKGIATLSSDVAGTAWYRSDSRQWPFAHNRVRKIIRDSDGDIVVCTDKGVNIYNRTTRQFVNHVVYDRTGHYSTAWAYGVVDDGRGRYWIGSYMGGVFVIDKQRLKASGSGSVVADRHYRTELQGLHASMLAIDGHDNVWVTFYEGGADIINTRTMKVRHLLKRIGISNMATDPEGRVWTGSDGTVRCYRPDGSLLREFRFGKGGDRHVQAMAEVDGRMWVVTGRWCRVFSADGQSTCFATPDGPSFAIWYDRERNTAYLGGNDGLTTVSPRLATDTNHSGRLLLSGLAIGGKPFYPENEDFGKSGTLRFNHDQNNITLYLTNLPYSGQPQAVYAYRLNGIDHEWQYISSKQPVLTYNGLPHGKYRLEVCVVDGYGNPHTEVYSTVIDILPPWYLTIWAKTVYVLAFIGLMYWTVNYYMVRKRLDEESKARRQVLDQSAARAEFYKSLSRKLREPIGRIMEAACGLLPEEKDNGRNCKIDSIRRNSAEMNNLVYNLLDIENNAADSHTKTSETADVDIPDFCRRAVDDFRSSKLGRHCKTEFHTDVPKAIVTTDILQLHAVITALLNYASSHTGDKTKSVTLGVMTADAEVRIYVVVPGMTVSQEKLPLLFNRYYASSDNVKSMQDEPTLGLPDVKDIADRCHGTVTAVSDTASGTIVTVAFEGNRVAKKQNDGVAVTSDENMSGNADSRLFAEVTATTEKYLSDSEFNVARLQELSGIGSKLLYRRIKQMTGKSPVEFIRHVRMQRAALLLKEGKFSVSEVMYMVGFSNSGYFSKCFSKAYGMTPAEYARKS